MTGLSVGIGCRLHTTADQIEAAVHDALGSCTFDAIGVVASIDSKAQEAGLLEFCARHALRLQFFSRAQIATVSVSHPSAAASAHLGVDGVCEPCALLAASEAASTASTARLVVPKTVHAGVTVAIASSVACAAPQTTHHASRQQNRP
ncbi:cobalamin biosynthesis protein [Paraburkholderia sp. BCC1884]|uniref:cobalamin biosynthesis protein n=1 Tax=Paraburkholderia sp. BCC1884 TaxID=2562668 RepID=UPI0011836AA8|nr:cobalamin biosynthesis protein [Paraburkholderia sp. BCC1884]